MLLKKLIKVYFSSLFRHKKNIIPATRSYNHLSKISKINIKGLFFSVKPIIEYLNEKVR